MISSHTQVKLVASNPSTPDALSSPRNPRIKLRQWRALDAVVTCGSFANAADFLHVSQPAISYSIGKLEELLGVPLLRTEGRKAQITEAGRLLLERSRHLLSEASELEEYAEKLRNGFSTEVNLVVGRDLPIHVLLPALRLFNQNDRGQKVLLSELAATDIDTALHENAVELAIYRHIPEKLHGGLFSEVEYVAVAHPNHALFRLSREIYPSDLITQTQITSCADRDVLSEWASQPMLQRQQWQMDDLENAIGAVLDGMGYAWLPRYRVNAALQESRIKILPLAGGTIKRARFFLVHRPPSELSIGASELLRMLQSSAPGVSYCIR